MILPKNIRVFGYDKNRHNGVLELLGQETGHHFIPTGNVTEGALFLSLGLPTKARTPEYNTSLDIIEECKRRGIKTVVLAESGKGVERHGHHFVSSRSESVLANQAFNAGATIVIEKPCFPYSHRKPGYSEFLNDEQYPGYVDAVRDLFGSAKPNV